MKIFRYNLNKLGKILLIIICSGICILAQNPLARFEKNIESDKYNEIEKDLFSYVVANPKDADGFALLARLRFRQNRLNEAKSLSNKALTLDKNSLRAKLTLAETHSRLNERERSLAILESISLNEISDESTRLNIGEIYAQIGECPKALILADKLSNKIKNGLALPMRADCYLQLGDRNKITELIPNARLAIKQDPKVAVRFAGVLSKFALHIETIELLRSVVAVSPKDTPSLLILAKSEISIKDFKNAKIHLAQAEKIEPESDKLLFVKAFWESEQGNVLQSLELLDRSLIANPDNKEVLARLVVTAMRANQSGKAVHAAQLLLDLEPENLEYLYLFGASSLQNNSLRKAEVALKKILEIRPDDSRSCLALGLTYAAQTDKIAEARNQMVRCLEIDPKNYEAAYQLGLSYKTQGETQKAIEYLEKTINIAPNNASALKDLGAVYLQIGLENQARTVLEKSVSLDSADADTHFQLSRLYNLIGERELAKKHLEIFQKIKNPKKDGM